ncbi:MAG: FAD-dependent oxidoreductase [Dehalococcoidia bacterium]
MDYDVIVLGTGAAGLTAAITAHAHGARVGLFERGEQVGGTSAWSGGLVWIPNNPHMAELEIPDSRVEAISYLMSMSQGMLEETLIEAYVDAGPEMVSFIESNSPVAFQIVQGFPDYHPEFPGGKTKGGRSLECPVFSFHELGDWAARVTVGRQMNGNMTLGEGPLGGKLELPPLELRQDRASRDERGYGQALVGRLLKGCLDRGIEPHTEARATDLVIEGGRVRGVRFEGPKGIFEVHAKGGVILATGGFEWNPALVKAFVRGPMTRPVSVPTNTGDGLKMAMKAGASLGNMREAWWVPTTDVPKAEGGGTWPYQVQSGKTKPHSIMVNRRGQRFTNEAANYNTFGAAFHVIDVNTMEYVNHPAWIVCDAHYLARYGLGAHMPGSKAELPAWIAKGETLAELAAAIGVPAAALEATVQRWNLNAAELRDPDFHRGESAHDLWWGDHAYEGAAATIGPLDTPPFYAVEVQSGALGTKGGPRTDTDGQVLDLEGEAIPGLYAAGNVMASAFGMTYGGAGGTLGPGMVFGYLSGKHAARAAAAAG